VEDMSRKAPVEVSQRYRSEIEVIVGRWKKLSAQLVEQCQKLEELMTKLQRFQVNQTYSASTTMWWLVGVRLVQNTFICLKKITPK